MCGGSGSGTPILNGVMWIVQSTQVSWRRPGTLTAPRVSIGPNETMIGAPTAAREMGANS